MDRKWMIGIGAGLLATAALVAVGAGAYELGQRDGERVIVAGNESVAGRIFVDHDGWRRGGPGHLVFPLLIIGLILLVLSRRRGRWCGPGPGWDGDPDGRYRRGWHDAMASTQPGTTPAPSPAPSQVSSPISPDPAPASPAEREPAPPEP